MSISSLLFYFCSVFGCTVSNDLDINKINELTITYFEQHSGVDSVELSTGSIEHSRVINWLERNKDEWKPYFVTVAPGDFMVSGVGFSLNIGDSWVILNYEHETNEYRQLSKSTKVGEFSYLDKIKP